MTVVRMLKASLIGRVGDAESILHSVQRAGLMHIDAITPPESRAGRHHASDDAIDMTARYRRARKGIASIPAGGRSERHKGLGLADVVDNVSGLLDQLDALGHELAEVESSIAQLQPWGRVEPIDVAAIRDAGVPIEFCVVTEVFWDALELRDLVEAGRLAWHIAHREDGELWVMFVGPAAAELQIVNEKLPDQPITVLSAQRESVNQKISGIQDDLRRYADYLGPLDGAIAAFADRAAILRCRDGALLDGPVFAVCGYIPAGLQHELQAAISKFPCALHLVDPVPGDPVPVQLDNGPMVRGFEAVVRAFSGISYWEKDFTWAVGILFVIFGSLCLLDGGYGLLLLITGGVLRRKGMRAFGDVFVFTGVLSVIVGMLGGQYFGLIVGRDILAGAHPPTPLAADPFACFIFSLCVGIVGMGFSYGMAIWQRGWKTQATGSLLLVFAAVTLVVAKTRPDWLLSPFVGGGADFNEIVATFAGIGEGVAAVLGGAGVLAWILWPEDVFGASKRIPNVAWTLYSGITGLAQDTMSHMRLFGIALSGSIMAMVVNKVGGGFGAPMSYVFAVFGHTAVFALALLSLYIHTNRLIFLEFGSKCFGGGHLWYEPLQCHPTRNAQA